MITIHGFHHGQTVQDRRTGHYGYVHAYGVLTARGPLAEVRWNGVTGGTETLTDALAARVVSVSGILPRVAAPSRPAVPTSFPDGVRAPRVTPRATRARKDAPAVTLHTCNSGRGPVWGRLTRGCPRCVELALGAPKRTWGSTR